MSRCEECINAGPNCVNCCDNPIYANYPRMSYFSAYKPTCPLGHTDCVCDPAYIKYHYPKWYKKLYGNKTPEEASEKCKKRIEEDPEEAYYCYDDEDK